MKKLFINSTYAISVIAFSIFNFSLFTPLSAQCTLTATPEVTSNTYACNLSGSGQVTAGSGTSPYTYFWSNGASTSSVSALTAGIYAVTIKDNGGCTTAAFLTITQPAFSTYTLSVIAGNGTPGTATSGIPATSSHLNSPFGVAVDASGNVYIADQDNQRVEKVNTSGILSFFAGTGTAGTATAGPANASKLNTPSGVAVDASGNVYIADYGNNRIEKVNTSGTLSFFAGTGTGGTPTAGPATASNLGNTRGVAVDDSGNVYIADYTNGRIEKVNTSGTLSFFAGTGTGGTATAGPATASRLNSPVGVAVDVSGNVYIDDYGNERVEKVTGGILSFFAGTGTAGTSTEGPATASELYFPNGVAVDASGNVYIADNGDGRIEEVNTSGILSFFAGPGTALNDLGQPIDVAIGSSGNVYIADQGKNEIEKVYPVPLSVNASVTQNASACNNTGIATSIVAAGSSPYTYSWSGGGGTNLAATGLSVGTYTITATDANGCIGTASANITRPSAIETSISSLSNILCYGGTGSAIANAVSGGTGPYTYSWSPGGGTTLAATGISAGTYTLTVTDNSGCTATVSATITQPPALSFTVVQTGNFSCNGSGSVGANAGVSGGTSPYTYSWYNGNSSSSVSGLSAGIYTLAITDANGCSATGGVIITAPQALLINFATITNVSCNGGNGGSVTISAGNSGNTTFSYEGAVQNWTVPAGITSATITVAGASGGSATSDANATDYGGNGTLLTGISSVIPGDNLSIVVGGAGGNGGIQAAGGGGGGSFVYDSNAAAFMGASAAYNSGYLYLVAAGGGGGGFGGQAGSAGGTDIIGTTTNGGGDGTGGTGGNGGSVGSATNLAPGGAGGAGWVGAGAGGTGGNPVSHDSYGGSPYDNFSGGAVTQNTPAGDVGGYGGGGGGGNDGGGGGGGYNGGGGGSDNGNGGGGGGSYLNGTLLSGPAATNSGNGYVTIAYSGSLGGTSPYTYSWTNGTSTVSTSISATGLSAGTYTITITDNNGCTGTASATISQPPVLMVSAVQNGNISCNGGGNVSANAGVSGGTSPYTYSWYNGNSTSSVSGLSAGSYSLTITDANGCSATGGVIITAPPALFINFASITNVGCYGGNGGSATISAGNSGSTTFSYVGAVQNWTVPAGVTSATITVAGGSGGATTGESAVPVYGGEGTVLTALSSLIPDDNLSIVVGGAGGNSNEQQGGGGGGGSFVYDSNAAAFMGASVAYGAGYVSAIAAGGGGAGFGDSPGSAGGISISGTTTNDGGDGSGGTGGNGGSAGAADYLAAGGAGGAGWISAGAGGVGPSPVSYGGLPYDNFSGGAVTQSTSDYNSGGYGGGGGGGLNGGGGGGGYNGGGGGSDGGGNGGGGGGSYLNGTLVGSPAATNSGNGYVTIAYSGSLGGTSPYTYSWTNGTSTLSTSINATGLSAGTYTITITDNNGCSASNTLVITQPGTLLASTTLMDNVSCYGGTNGLAKARVTGGTSPFTYSWSPVSNSTYIANNLSAGTYTLSVVDINGCTSSATATITQPANPLAEAVASITYPSCLVTTGTASIAVSGGTSPYTYIWNPNLGSTSTVSGLSVHDYVVEVKDAHGCATAVTFSISQPPIMRDSIVKALTVDVPCGTSNIGSATVGVKYGALPYTYSWSPNVSNSPTATGLSVGTYSVTVNDANGCRVTASVNITQANGLTVSIVITNEVSCYGGSTAEAKAGTSGGALPYTYSWSPNTSSTYLANGLSIGTYTVSVTDKNGCNGSAIATITQPTAMRDSMVSITNAECHGGVGTATFGVKGGTPPYTYTWNPNVSTTTTATGLAVRNYLVEVKDARGCNGTAITFNITQPTALSARTSSGSCSSGFGTASVQVSGGVSPYSYIWSPNVNSTSTSTGLSAGIYTITVIDNNSCSDLVTATITCPPEVLSPVGENTSGNACCNSSNENITLYPNPNSGQFTLELSVVSPDGFPGDGQSSEGNKESTVEIYNMLGQKISNEEMPGSSMQINISNQPSGVYLYRVLKTDGNLIGSGKVIIQK